MAKDSSFEDKTLLRPRTKDTGASVSKKKVFKIFFRRSQKQGLQNDFSSHLQNFNNSKNSAVLESRTGQISRT